MMTTAEAYECAKFLCAIRKGSGGNLNDWVSAARFLMSWADKWHRRYFSFTEEDSTRVGHMAYELSITELYGEIGVTVYGSGGKSPALRHPGKTLVGWMAKGGS